MLSKGFGRVILLLLMLMGGMSVLADDFDVISERLALQRYNFPQEKLHITTDKSRYMAGDTIWLRAFVVNAATHEPVDASKYCYVELLNPFDSLESRIKIKERNGVMQGYLALSPQLAEGSYTLAGYTMFMQNIDEGYFFKKRIEVMSAHSTRSSIVCDMERDPKNPSRVRVTTHYLDLHSKAEKDYRLMRYITADQRIYERNSGTSPVVFSLNEKESQGGVVLVQFDSFRKFVVLPPDEELDELRFFPEGGYLVPGVMNHVSVKALHANGSEASVTGRLLDGEGNEVATFATGHAGIGDFHFEPQSGVNYRAVCHFNGSASERVFDLPQVRSDATIVQVEMRDGSEAVVRAAGAKTDQSILVVQQRGVLLATGTDSIALPMSSMNAGVVQALLLDKRLRPLSERLFFVPCGETANRVKVNCDKEQYDSRDRVQVTATLEGFAAPAGNYAVSVTDDRSVIADSVSAIAVNLLLQSDLRGHLPDLAYYFAQKGREHELDALMMTHGWRRYDISGVLRGQLAEPSFPIEKGFSAAGTVLSEWKKKPVKDGLVQVLVPKLGYGNMFPTDDKGRFHIEGFELPDSAIMVLQAFNKKGGKEMNVTVDKVSFPNLSTITDNFKGTGPKADGDALGDYLEAEAKRMQYIDGMRNIVLGEVEVTAQVKRKEPEDVFQRLATHSYDEEYMEERQISSIEDVIRHIAGIMITGNRVVSRRSNENVGFFLDGIFIEPMLAGLSSGEGVYVLKGGTTYSAGGGTGTASELAKAAPNAYILKELDQQIPFDAIKRIDYISPGLAMALAGRGSAGGAIMITTKDGKEKNKKQKNYFLHTVMMQGVQRPAEFYSPDYDLGDCGMAPNTDLRNTLYWNPCVQVNNEGKSRFSFFAADVPNTTYTITIEGVTADGNIIATTHKVNKR
uniref:Uncharacterized protein n=1 Tax=uncultured bacterium 34R1 TaxID=581113 RepID=C0K033_9BACT|nr:hypothetical protein [uncultured bacterium 34R1]